MLNIPIISCCLNKHFCTLGIARNLKINIMDAAFDEATSEYFTFQRNIVIEDCKAS